MDCGWQGLDPIFPLAGGPLPSPCWESDGFTPERASFRALGVGGTLRTQCGHHVNGLWTPLSYEAPRRAPAQTSPCSRGAFLSGQCGFPSVAGACTAPGTLGTLPTGVGVLDTQRPPQPGSSGAPDVQVGPWAIPQSAWPSGHECPAEPPCARHSRMHSCPGIVQAAPHEGAETTGGGGIRRETSHTRWEAESECHVPATWRPPRLAGQAAHHTLPPVREGNGAGLTRNRPTTPPHTHAELSTVANTSRVPGLSQDAQRAFMPIRQTSKLRLGHKAGSCPDGLAH